MKTEIIIAARGEQESLLDATVIQAALAAPVCVVFDGREKGGNHKTPLLEKHASRIVTPWQRPRGPGQARHYAIETSEADVVVILDGHMALPPDWLQEIEAHHKRYKTHVTCNRMVSIKPDGMVYEDGHAQGGAWLCLKSREVAGEQWALSAKWNKPPREEAGPVSAIMGACYAFRRTWYERIGSPLRMLSAWGGDDEVLSLGTHFLGGKVWLLEGVVSHVYMAPHTGREKDAGESARIWQNRYAVVDALPCDEETRSDLVAWLRKTRRVYSDLPRPPAVAREIREVWKAGRVSWDKLLRDEIIREPTEEERALFLGSKVLADDAKRDTVTPGPAPTPPPEPLPLSPPEDSTPPQIIQRKAIVCKRCGALDSFRQKSGFRPAGTFARAYARCSNCGHKAQIRRQDVS